VPHSERQSTDGAGSGLSARGDGIEAGVASSAAPGRGRAWLFGVLLVAVTIIAYLPVWRAGFIWDDDTFAWRNPLIQSPDGLFRLWFTTASQDYFPLTSTVLWVEWRLWGASPLGYHLVNVLLHAFSAVLLWRVLRRLRITGAGLAAAIFAVHPVNAESVAWVTELKNTLAMFFFLLSVLCYVRWEDQWERREEEAGAAEGAAEPDAGRPKPWLLYCLSLGLFLCGLLSKTAVAPLPVVLLGLAWWRHGRLWLRDLWRTLPFFGAAAAVGLVALWFQYHRAIGASMLDVRNDSFWGRLAGAGWAVWFYLYKALLPLHLSFVYPRWHVDASRVISYVPGLLVVAVFLVCWRYRRGWGRAGLLGLGYFVVMLLPVLGLLNIYFMRYSLVADHWQYFAIIGPITLAAAGLTWALGKLRVLVGTRSTASQLNPNNGDAVERVPTRLESAGFGTNRSLLYAAVSGALVLVLAALTWREALTYRDLMTLWTETVARNPAAGIAHNNLGSLLFAQGKLDEAVAHYRQAVALQPNAADVYSNFGAALLGQRRFEEAIVQLRQAIRIQPDLGMAHYNLGNTLLQAGRVDEAIPELRQVIELEPGLAEPHMNLGNALLAKGQVAEALAHLQKAVELQPNLAAAHLNLANALVQQGRADEAIAQFQQVLATQPGSAVAHNGLGSALLQKGQADQALEQYQAALRIAPGFAEAHLNLANLLIQRKQPDEAVAHFKAALQLQPKLVAAHNNLANALLAKQQVDEAIAQFEEALQLQPNLAEAHNGLANALLQKGRTAEAVTHYEAALAGVPNHPYLLNNLAWVLATCPDAAIRNGPRAVELARQAERASGGKDPALLGTLAAAYAEAGRFPDAIATAQRALDLATAQADAKQVETLRERLKLFQAGSPFHEGASPHPSPPPGSRL
jgi:protein O-mannosyl-transferase